MITLPWRKHIGGLLLEFVAVCLGGLGITSLMFFIASKRPQEASPLHGQAMPAKWEAGFENHGAYSQWYLIREHPIGFAASLGSMLAGYFILNLFYIGKIKR